VLAGGGRRVRAGGQAYWPGRRYPDCYAFARGGLDIEPRPSLLRLANVQHLATAVSGLLAREVSALALAAVLHPTAAVCGIVAGSDPAAELAEAQAKFRPVQDALEGRGS
jgi:isochorismate synthase EntC